jgi:hypothetical protein
LKDITSWFSKVKISLKHRNEHTNLIEKHFPIIIKNSPELNFNENQYVNEEKCYVEYDCCIRACMVFVGDRSDLLYCTECKESRYLPCSLCMKSGRDITKRTDQKCSHHSINSRPRRTIRYRSITLLLIQLLQFDSFLEIIKYKFSDECPEKFQSYKDGESYKRNKKEMEKQFEDFKKTLDNDEDIEAVDIFLSWFFDGTQLFTSRVSDFAPMYVSIQNLPYCLRHIHGVGSFLLSLFTSKNGDPLEDFLLNDCFIAELQHLEKGQLLQLGKRNIYLQARLNQHIQDLIGSNKSLKVSSQHNSLSGCAHCNSGEGQSVFCGDSKSTVKYLNNRHWTSLRDPTRSNGYSRQCCPLGFYNSTIPITEPFKDRNTSKIEEYSMNQVNPEKLKICESFDKYSQSEINKFLQTKYVDKDGKNRKILISKQTPYSWFDEINISDYSHFKKYLLFFPHCCYKMPRGIWKRTTDKVWIERILACQQTGEPYQGVKGAWPFFQLSYASIEFDVSPCDLPHSLKCLFGDTLDQIKNKGESRINKKMSEEIKNEIKKVKGDENPNEKDDKSPKPPWVFTATEQDKADAYIECILRPSDSPELSLPLIFKQSGNMKISNLVTVFTSLINLVLLASKNMKFAYKQYHRMFARIVNRMQNNDIIKKDIEPMFWRARQWLNLSEGLFPMSEMTIMKHFQPDTIKHIPNQGPLSGWHSLNGETLNSKTKQRVKSNGGRKIENSAYDKLFEVEKIKMDEVYSIDLVEMMSSSNISKNKYPDLFYDIEKEMFIIDRCKNDIAQSKNAKLNNLNSFEFNKIVEFINDQIIKRYKDQMNAIKYSSFYRVCYFLRKYKENNETLLSVIKRMYNKLIIEKDSLLHIFKGKYTANELVDIYTGNNCMLVQFDLVTLEEIYDNLIKAFKCGSKATTMGIKHHGRGFKYSQKMNNLDRFNIEFSESPFSNYLNSNWYKKNQYNSWCQVKYENSCQNSACYGQLNYFFTLNITTDDFVSSLYIASVTCRETKLPDFSINYDELSGDKLYGQILPLPHIVLRKDIEGISTPITSYDSNQPLFICFEKILRTKVGSIGFIKRGLDDFIPILVKTEKTFKPYLFTYVLEQGKKNKNPHIIKLADESLFPIEMLGLINLDPENLIEEEKQKIFDEIDWIDWNIGQEWN